MIEKSKFLPAAKKRKSFSAVQAQLVYRHAGWILCLMVLLSILAIPLAKKLKLHANFMDLLPAKTQSILDLKDLNSYVGGSTYLIAVLESPSEETARLGAKKLAEHAAAFPEVGYVNNRTDVPVFASRKFLFLSLSGVEKLHADVGQLMDFYRKQANPFYIDLMKEKAPAIDLASYEVEEKISRIGSFSTKGADSSFMQVVLIKPQHPLSDFERSEKLFAKTRASFEDIKKDLDVKQPLSLTLTGPYKVRYDEYRTIAADLQRTGLLSAVLIGLIMLAGFRSFRSLFYIYLPIGIVILLTCAFTYLAIGYLNLISGFLFGILLGMGIDYAIHLRIHLDQSLKTFGNMKAAIEETYAEIGKPIFTSCLTTSAAFFSLAISPFEGFRHFGIISGTGILLSFVVIFYGMPSLMTVIEKYFPSKKTGAGINPQKIKISRRFVHAALAASLLFSVYSVMQIKNIKFDYNFAHLQAKDEGILLAERIYRHFGIELTPAAFMMPGRKAAVDFAQEINRYIRTHPETTLDFAASIMSHVPRQQSEKILLLREIDALIAKREPLLSKLDAETQRKIEGLRGQLKASGMDWQDLPAGMKRQYEGADRKISVVYVFPKGSILDGQVAKSFVKELRSLPLPEGVRLAGEPVIYADILTLLERDTPRSLALSFLIVVFVLFLHFKKPAHVLWVLLPVLLAFLWMIGMAGATQFKFNYLNVAILPSVLGAGIDNGIYIFNCYKEKRQGKFLNAVWNTGKGVILASFTAIAAFTSLIGARHAGMASMGILGFFGFISIFFTSVVVLPGLIQVMESRSLKLSRRSRKALSASPLPI